MAGLPTKLRVWLVGDRRFPLFSAFGASQFGDRWNSIGVEVVYASSSIAGAILELVVPTNGIKPPGHHGFIWIDLPQGISYEIVDPTRFSASLIPETSSRQFGDEWVQSNRSCVLFVPSVVVPAPVFNMVINPNHGDASKIRWLKTPKPLEWDDRLFST